MNASYINPFLAATLNLFKTTFSVSATPGEPYVLNDLLKHRWEISGVMVMTGSAIGVIAIRLTSLVSNKLLEKSGLTYSSTNKKRKSEKGKVLEY